MIAIQYQLRGMVRNKVWENLVLRVDDSLRSRTENQTHQIWIQTGSQAWAKVYDKIHFPIVGNIL